MQAARLDCRAYRDMAGVDLEVEVITHLEIQQRMARMDYLGMALPQDKAGLVGNLHLEELVEDRQQQAGKPEHLALEALVAQAQMEEETAAQVDPRETLAAFRAQAGEGG